MTLVPFVFAVVAAVSGSEPSAAGAPTCARPTIEGTAGPDVIEPWALAFRDWVVEKLTQNDRQALLDYRQQAPFAVRNHPSDEHLLPLFFALGAGERFGLVHQGFTLGALGMDIYRFD